MPAILLVDNGSARPDATLKLRDIAGRLRDKTGYDIYPVSLQHADKISPRDLGGVPAFTARPFLEEQIKNGEREFIILPLFFGVSRALTSFLPQQIHDLKQTYGDFFVHTAEVVYPLPHGEPLFIDMMYKAIMETATRGNIEMKDIVLVDHGTPVPHITHVRNHVASALRKKFDIDVQIDEAVMERREGAEYDFNGPLLSRWLEQYMQDGPVNIIVALMFFLPGRHAGNGGDIASICQDALLKYPGSRILLTPLIGDLPGLVPILETRLLSAMDELNR